MMYDEQQSIIFIKQNNNDITHLTLIEVEKKNKSNNCTLSSSFYVSFFVEKTLIFIRLNDFHLLIICVSYKWQILLFILSLNPKKENFPNRSIENSFSRRKKNYVSRFAIILTFGRKIKRHKNNSRTRMPI